MFSTLDNITLTKQLSPILSIHQRAEENFKVFFGSFLCLRQYKFLPCVKRKTTELNLKTTCISLAVYCVKLVVFAPRVANKFYWYYCLTIASIRVKIQHLMKKKKASADELRRWEFYALLFLDSDHIWPHVLTISLDGIYGTYGINGIICTVWFTKSDYTD